MVGVTLLLWASAFVAIRHLADAFGPGPLSLGRLTVRLAGPRDRPERLALLAACPSRRDWAAMVAIGVLWFGIYNVALNAGERRIDAGTAAMLIQVSPILIAVLAVLGLRERPTAHLVAGIALAFGGVALIALSTSTDAEHDVLGVLLCLLSAVVYAISLVLQKPVVARVSALQVTWVACTVGAGRDPALRRLSWSAKWATPRSPTSGWLAYLGVFPTAIAFTTYAFALRFTSASNLGVTTYLVPPITVLLSWAFLAETPPTVAYVGGVLALIGVAVARRRPRSRVPLDVPSRPAD